MQKAVALIRTKLALVNVNRMRKSFFFPEGSQVSRLHPGSCLLQTEEVFVLQERGSSSDFRSGELREDRGTTDLAAASSYTVPFQSWIFIDFPAEMFQG